MSSPRKYSEEKLLFRRQFNLGLQFVEMLPGWPGVRVRDSIRATAHPDSPVTPAVDGEKVGSKVLREARERSLRGTAHPAASCAAKERPEPPHPAALEEARSGFLRWKAGRHW